MDDFIRNCICMVVEYDLELKSCYNISMPRPATARLGRSEKLIEEVVSSTSSSLNGSSSTVS